MKKIVIIVAVIILGVFINVNTCFAESSEEEKLLLIDPGHGGFDGGAEVNGAKEKDINLSISLFLKEELIKAGYDVVMTREKDEALRLDKSKFKTHKAEDLAARCKMKVDTNCDMFLSIHMNMFTESKYFGGQVWYSRYAGSKKLAELIQEGFKRNIDSSNNRTPKPAGDAYKVLRSNDIMPSVIVECGFLSNANEAEKLRNKAYQRKIAQSIADSVKTFYKTSKLEVFPGE